MFEEWKQNKLVECCTYMELTTKEGFETLDTVSTTVC